MPFVDYFCAGLRSFTVGRNSNRLSLGFDLSLERRYIKAAGGMSNDNPQTIHNNNNERSEMIKNEWKLDTLDKALAEVKSNPKRSVYERIKEVLETRRDNFALLGSSEALALFKKTVDAGVGRTTFMRSWKDAGLCKQTSNGEVIELPKDIFND